MSAQVDVAELLHLSADLGNASDAAFSRAVEATRESAERLQRGWRYNATITAGRHGKHYPKAITSEMFYVPGREVEAEIGPEIGRKQGGMGMGFEYGSVNQPPHNDAGRALAEEQPRWEQALADTMAGIL